MDYKTMLALALPLSLGIVGVACAIGLGKVVSSAMDATGRQPEAATKILINMATGCAFIEALTIYVLVVVFNFLGKI
ncbi:MAG TPA: ATP synthase F0 subunit C [Candidatus Omnitrophota bacterium]|nr:ATP synthase F0 subunit C [Candidatus Omnitrophota bacterium]HPN88566.1 ATP synthase F0 subunit C [Candidatus Omnitrophota bacterium]